MYFGSARFYATSEAIFMELVCNLVEKSFLESLHALKLKNFKRLIDKRMRSKVIHCTFNNPVLL